MSLKQYYEQELNKLYTEAQRFAEEYPEQAGALGLERHKSNDPHVQRLLEGCAFLTAKIHQMADDEADHLPAQLIQRLWPQLSESFPSISMLQAVSVNPSAKPHTLPVGTAVETPLLGEEQTACKFKTTLPMRVAPVHIENVEHTIADTQSLAITFNIENGWNDLEIDALPLFIHTNRSAAYSIIRLLSQGQINLEVYADEEPVNATGIRIVQTALDPASCLNQSLSNGLYAQQLIFETFAFPEKMQHIQLTALNTLNIPDKTKSIRFVFNAPITSDQISKITLSDFKLFVVPAINRYQEDCEPILHDHKHHRYLISPDHARANSIQLVSIVSVKGLSDADLSATEYASIHKVHDSKTPYYVLQRVAQRKNKNDAYLSLSSPFAHKETVSVRADVCNGSYPQTHLKTGELSFVEKQHEKYLKVSNIHQPSPMLPAGGKNKSEYLLKQLCVLVEDIHTAEHLKTLLKLLNRGENLQILKRINAITHLESYTKALIKKGVYYRVQGVKIDLDDSGFISHCDVYCFASLLHAFFQTSAMIATVVETTFVCHPSKETFTWLGRV